MTYKLNGINYTEMLLTDEELAVVKAMRNKTDGCLKCEGEETIHVEGSCVSIKDDSLEIENTYMFEDNIQIIQISYCPFCGKKL